MQNLIYKQLAKFGSSQNLRKTALHKYHIDVLKAKMVEFAGYDMPVQYPEGVMKEHLHCRENCSLFDVSHMGQVKIYGKDRIKFLETITVGDVRGLQDNQACLSLILNEKAGIIDDTIITKFPDHIHMVINAGNKFIDLEHFDNVVRDRFKGQDLSINYIEDRSLVAIQGPKAHQVLQQLVQHDLNKVKFMYAYEMKIEPLNINVLVSRCGYTGEDGFEISVKDDEVVKFCDLLLSNQQVKPAGLGSRDSLRLEAGLCLHGNDMNQELTPAEATLMWTVRKESPETKFIGYEALEEQKVKGVTKKRVGFVVEGAGILRPGSELLNEKGEKVGDVCSGTFAPILKQGIGMAYVKSKFTKVGTKLSTVNRGKQLNLQVKKMPFVPAKYFKLQE